MQTLTYNHANTNTAKKTISAVQAEAFKKITMFTAILTCLVAAINL